MDEVKKESKTYVEYLADKELNEEKSRPSVEPKELTKGERSKKSLANFWFYNKWKVLIGAVVVIALISFVVFFVQNFKKKDFAVVLVNSQVTEEFNKAVYEFDNSIVEKGIKESGFKTEVRDAYRHYLRDDKTEVVDENISGSIQRLSQEFMQGLVDVLIVNTRCADEYNNSNGILPIDEVLTAEELDNIGEDMLYYIDGKPMGIKVEASSFLKDHLYYRDGDDYIIVVSKFSKNTELNREFILYMLAY